MTFYHGTLERFVGSGSFAKLHAGRGQLGPRFYLTPVLEVAVWFARYYAPLRPLSGTDSDDPCVLVFKLGVPLYENLCRDSLVLAIGRPPYDHGFWFGGPGMLPQLDAAALAIAPIADFEHLSHFVQVAVSERHLHFLEPLVEEAIRNRLRPDDPALSFDFPAHWRIT